jgi:uncharacterized secreted repeat protein (TIGR03808 family)
MDMNRRAVLGLISAGMMLPAHLALAQDETARIEAEIAEATRRKRPWLVPSGITLAGSISLPDGAHLIGRRANTRLVLSGGGPLFRVARAARITFEGVTFDGGARPGSRNAGLLQGREIADLRMQDCIVERFGGNGVALDRCGGRITGCQFRDHGRAAVFALDSMGLSIDANVVERCGENGIMVWRTAKGEDGTALRGNRIQDIRADAGGSGEYGNAIGLFRAGGVIAEANVIRRVAYSAVRNNSGSNITVANNNIAACGEVALYAEFAFDGTVISANTVDGAWNGIEVTNFADHGGKIAAVSGNVIRNIRRGKHPWNGEIGGGKGIFVEGDAAISGNVVDNADQTGLQLGWGPSLRDVTATGNTIRNCGNGIEISVAPGAGHATVTGNRIAGSRQHAIVGKQWHKIATGDLAVTGAGDWAKITLSGNVAS